MITDEQIRQALLEGGMKDDVVGGIPATDIEHIRKALPEAAAPEGLADFLFSDDAQAAYAAGDSAALAAAADEHFAKGMKGKGKDDEDEEDEDGPDEDKIKSMADKAFGGKGKEGDDPDDGNECPDCGEDLDADGKCPECDNERLEKGLGDDLDDGIIVDAEELLEPILKAFTDREDALMETIDGLREEVQGTRDELGELRKGLSMVTEALGRIEPIQKAFTEYLGNQATPAGRPVAPSAYATRNQQVADFDMSVGDFEVLMQKGLARQILTPEAAAMYRESWGTPNLALHHAAIENAQAAIAQLEEFDAVNRNRQ
jgi:hypothetical protein